MCVTSGRDRGWRLHDGRLWQSPFCGYWRGRDALQNIITAYVGGISLVAYARTNVLLGAKFTASADKLREMISKKSD